jgi:cytochrome c peroxidase
VRSIAGYEACAKATAFASKFDAVLAGKAQIPTQEQAGYDLFRSEACAPPPLVLLIGLAPAR